MNPVTKLEPDLCEINHKYAEEMIEQYKVYDNNLLIIKILQMDKENFATGFAHYVGGNKSAYDFIREFLNKASGEDIKPLAEKVKRWLKPLVRVASAG